MNSLSHCTSYQEYRADSGRGTGREKVICILLNKPEDILSKNNNFIISQLRAAGIAASIGLYFYRFKNTADPFIKIGECTRSEGIEVRLKRGWHGTRTYPDTYLSKKSKNGYTDSKFLLEIRKISAANPAYFVFYEHRTVSSHPKIDEIYAYRMHKRLFRKGTASPERINSNPVLARHLIWHKGAFAEVVRCRLPDGTAYPSSA